MVLNKFKTIKMKRIILLLMVLVSITINAQKKLSYGIGVGGNAIADQCATLDGNLIALDGNVTHNFNEKLGLGIYGGYSRLQLDDVKDSNFFRANLELESNLLKLTNLQTDKFLLLAHGGPGVSYNSASKEVMPNIGGGLDLVYMLTERLGLGLGYRGTGNFLQDVSLGGTHQLTNRGINSNVHNGFLRAVWRPEFPKKEDKITALNNRVSELNRTVNNFQPSTIINKCCEDKIHSEFIYFDFDKSNINRSELAAAESAVEKAGTEDYILIKGWSCPRFGTKEYNYKLANKRVENVAKLIIGTGFPENRIITEVIGRDIDRDSDNPDIRAMARRVELSIVKE